MVLWIDIIVIITISAYNASFPYFLSHLEILYCTFLCSLSILHFVPTKRGSEGENARERE